MTALATLAILSAAARGDDEAKVVREKGVKCLAETKKRVQEVEQVVGVLPGSVEADDEVDGAAALDDAVESLAEQRVAGRGLRERAFAGRGLEIVTEEGGVVAVARGVDADADGSGRSVGRWRNSGLVW